MTDLFDTPGPAKETAQERPGLRETLGRGLDTAGLPFEPLARRWKASSDARSEQRTPEAREALMDANRARRDAMRDLRRDRKAFENARGEVAWWNVVNGERRAARAVVRDSRALAREAASERRAAKKAYPMTLPGLAARCHAAHLLPAGLWALASDSLASSACLSLSVAAVAVNAAGVALGLRHVAASATDVALEAWQPSQEERELLQKLDPKVFAALAEPRGLSDVVPAGAGFTDSGITAKLTLNGQMTVKLLRDREDHLRAVLRLRKDLRISIEPDRHGGRARLTIRTRSKADGLVMSGWKPGDAWAVDTVTGEVIPVPLGKRILFAGTSGSGKSWSARPLMAEASEHADHRLVIFDRKHVEARNWEHRARTACELDDMYELCEELEAEGEARLKGLPRGQDVVKISASMPRITVFVDEGGELLSDCKGKDKESGRNYEDIISTLRTVARKYRAAEIILVWCTQKPSLTGDGHGLDSQIAGQMMMKAALALATSTDTQVVFGPDAIEKGWKAHDLPMPGYALLRDQEKGGDQNHNTLKMRAMSPQDVIGLPDRPVWSRTVSSTGATAADVKARQQLEAQPAIDPWAKAPAEPVEADDAPTVILGSDIATISSVPSKRVPAADRDDQIMEALRDDPCTSLSDLARITGAHKQTVKRSLDRMAADGLVVQDADGCWSPAE